MGMINYQLHKNYDILIFYYICIIFLEISWKTNSSGSLGRGAEWETL